ncbi:hypothetical protein MNB_SV-8-293 [hydrothermal vent metagenome]|uniref:Uncharacterized protein n=1 Tax=hydrothermal vent metagenome TaxID=652676 RepID=A0A1W1BNG4_9ZZZZ
MKIISKFQDYYDIGIAYGVDEKLRFERKEICLDEYSQYDNHSSYIFYKKHHYYRLKLFYFYVGFCGRKYPLIQAKIEKIVKSKKETHYSLEIEDSFYTLESFEDFFETWVDTSKEWIKAYTDYYGYHEKREFFRKKEFISSIAKYYKKTTLKEVDLFKKHHIPYFVVMYEEVMVDNKPHLKMKTIATPRLKQYKFAKAVPPMQAFQEISMYLGQLDLAEDNIVQIDDKYLAQGKGFDSYSFKKIPTKRGVLKC